GAGLLASLHPDALDPAATGAAVPHPCVIGSGGEAFEREGTLAIRDPVGLGVHPLPIGVRVPADERHLAPGNAMAIGVEHQTRETAQLDVDVEVDRVRA